jgi:hypothetical protein
LLEVAVAVAEGDRMPKSAIVDVIAIESTGSGLVFEPAFTWKLFEEELLTPTSPVPLMAE